jgi:hypothetical protein
MKQRPVECQGEMASTVLMPILPSSSNLYKIAKSPRQAVEQTKDRDYGPRLRGLLESGPVWAIDSPANRDVAQEIWQEFPSRGLLDGITIFSTEEVASHEEALIAKFDTIDMHHGIYSADPPYTIVRVMGASLAVGLSRRRI